MPENERLKLPVSIKAALIEGGRVCLLLNRRDQWELPGGRLEPGETPRQCLVREVREELGFTVVPGRILDAWVFTGVPGKEVLVIVFIATRQRAQETLGRNLDPAAPAISGEHRAVAWYSSDELGNLTMPPGFATVLREALNDASGTPA